MNNPDAVLILPSETRAREFDAKLLLACHAAEQGMQAIIGAKKNIDQGIARLPRGIYVGKSVTNRNLFIFRMLRRMGFTVTTCDEEGLVWATPELYRRTKVGIEALNEPACLFAWGKANADAWREHPRFAGRPIHLTGNPRADLLRPELRAYFAAEVETLRTRHGRFLLINTNFSRLNHYYPGESRQQRLIEDAGGRIHGPDDPRLGLARHKARLFRHFLDLLPKLARRFPHTTIIIRPHPSENHDVWRQAASDCPNVQVLHEGNVVPWLLAAETVIHNGCTTAVEAFLLGRTPLAYRPITATDYDHALPNGLSVQAFNDSDLLDQAEMALHGNLQPAQQAVADQQQLASLHIASYNGATACERMLQVAASLRDPQPAPPPLLTRAAGQGAARGRALVKSLERLLPGHRNNATYLRHLFPPLTCAQVEQQIARLGTLLGRFQNLQVREITTNVFTIQ